MQRFKLISIFLAIMLCSAVMGQNEKFKALFIYNFTNYIDWPSDGSGVFTISVIGETPIIYELEAISKLKKINGLPIEIKKVAAATEVGKSHIVFVPGSKKKMLSEISQHLSGKNTLIISDNANGEFGINFVEIEGKQSFQISKSNIEAHRLKVSSSLLTLGISVN